MKNDLIYNAWRDSEAYQVPMTEEGERLAELRYYGFKKGWEYAMFYLKHGNIGMKDYLEKDKIIMTNHEKIIMTIPEMWKVIEITTPKGETIRKVFAGWRGGYLDSNRWRLNSGIESVEELEDAYIFHGYSGSKYACHKNLEGITGWYHTEVLNEIIKNAEDGGAQVKIIDYGKGNDESR